MNVPKIYHFPPSNTVKYNINFKQPLQNLNRSIQEEPEPFPFPWVAHCFLCSSEGNFCRVLHPLLRALQACGFCAFSFGKSLLCDAVRIVVPHVSWWLNLYIATFFFFFIPLKLCRFYFHLRGLKAQNKMYCPDSGTFSLGLPMVRKPWSLLW